MPKDTGIEWCDSTINPTTGCEGCELWNGRDVRHCYAGNLHETRLAKSYPALYDDDFQNVRLAPGRMMKAARWADLRGKERPDKPWLNGFPRTIFVGDMGDFCSRAVPTEYIVNEIIGAIRSKEGQRHFWFLLTKQIRRLAEISEMIGGLPDNCMAMTTVTDQPTADKRIPDLQRVQCRWRGLSGEPLLGPICFRPQCETVADKLQAMDSGDAYRPVMLDGIDWLITGGESDQPKSPARPSDPECFRFVRDQAKAAGVPFFFKQWDEANKHRGRLLDGIEHNGMPRLI